jgi:Na+/H+ antiporter NhaD/arsenite permease-like protein
MASSYKKNLFPSPTVNLLRQTNKLSYKTATANFIKQKRFSTVLGVPDYFMLIVITLTLFFCLFKHPKKRTKKKKENKNLKKSRESPS